MTALRHGLAGILLVWLLGLAGPAPGAPLDPGRIEVGGRLRDYAVHLPNGRRPTAPAPLLLVLHGGNGASAETMMARYRFDEIGDRAGVIVVYPQGVDRQWNDGRNASFRRGRDNADVDDVGFVRALIDVLVRDLPVDRQRIYVAGMSNGGMMTYRLGIELGDRLAGIAAIIANVPANLIGRTPAAPLPVLIMNGTDDPVVPWNGGPVRVLGKSYGEVVSSQRSVDYWLAADRQTAPPRHTWPGDPVPADGCRPERIAYGEPGAPGEVVLYAMHGGGHNVPGADTPNLPGLLGRKCIDLDAAEAIWAFLAPHARP
ncbi:esterase [Parasulfuritortus cantonensis]|uniref:Esterase n=1 Tax=Parasulfuritortus cantonensis TaxID=2528202 RepID=A0A4R1B784_9PROT|nr:PHB depolymerase family esterase [Parasulfuritortus cantonensis]TCJ11553.1 esterase [Parasulfuritortus cantonensis]